MFQNESDYMITIDELCDMLCIGKNTAYYLLNTKQIDAFKIGRNWKIPKDSVIKFITNERHR